MSTVFYFLALASLVSALFVWLRGRQVRKVARRALVLDVAEAIAAPDGALVAVSGVAGAAPETRGPYSGAPCAWAHGVTTRRWREYRSDWGRDRWDDDHMQRDETETERSERVHEARAGRSFALRSTAAGRQVIWVDAGEASGDRLEAMANQTLRTPPPWLSEAMPGQVDLPGGAFGQVIGALAQASMYDQDLRYEVTERGVRDGEVISVMGTMGTVRGQRVIGPGPDADLTLDASDDPRGVIRGAKRELMIAIALVAVAAILIACGVIYG